MTTSKSDLEAKEGQIPNESNFLEFVSLLGSLSARAGGPSAQEDQGAEGQEGADASTEASSHQAGRFPSCPGSTCTLFLPPFSFGTHCCFWSAGRKSKRDSQTC